MRLNDLPAAFMLLTRLPVARFARADRPADLVRCVWAFPIVGLVVGAIGGLVYWLAHRAGMPPVLAAAWALATTIVATGGLHEDGLADTADGFGGGATQAGKMEIMRDSRIGSYGALALFLSLTVRIAAIAAVGQPVRVMTTTILAGMVGRSGMLVLLFVLRPARDLGMGASIGAARAGSVALGLGIAIVASFFLLPGRQALAVIVFGLASCLGLGRLARAQIGGYTGDVLGASEVVAECVVMTVMAAAFGI